MNLLILVSLISIVFLSGCISQYASPRYAPEPTSEKNSTITSTENPYYIPKETISPSSSVSKKQETPESKWLNAQTSDFTKLNAYKPSGYNYGKIYGHLIVNRLLSEATVGYRTDDAKEVVWEPINITAAGQLISFGILEFIRKSEPQNDIDKMVRILTSGNYVFKCSLKDFNNYTFTLCDAGVENGDIIYMIAQDRFLFSVSGGVRNKQNVETVVVKFTELLDKYNY